MLGNSLNRALLGSSLLVLALGAPTIAQELPRGEVSKYTFAESKIFPGTVREVSIYVPKQYDPAKPACVYVNQDGIQYNAPAVFDQLIASGAMPVTIGVFVTPGRVPAIQPGALDRFNRSLEYDGLGDRYARFLLDEVLPFVESKTTQDGRPIHLSQSGNDRCIAGSSSGAIAAFTAAWERPDAFQRVFSAIGTYVGLRGGNDYPTLLRKTEPKPIRIFLQDGANDLNIYGGDWWMANQEMERALVFAGYEVNQVWGDGGHNAKHATEIFPDAMRWLWKDWPNPIAAGNGSPQLQEVVIPGEGWTLVGEGYRFTEGAVAHASGDVYFNDIPNSKAYHIAPDGALTPWRENTNRANGQGVNQVGQFVVAETGASRIVSVHLDGTLAGVLAENIKGNDLVVRSDGTIYVTEPSPAPNAKSKVWMLREGQSPRVVDEGLTFANGITLSPDQSLLYVADSRSHWVYSYQIQPDGTLAHKQQFYHLHAPDTADDAGADGMKTDRDGRLYVATRVGIQICDQAGRVNIILPSPAGRISNLAFGGPNFDVLYITCGDKVFKRKVKPQGALPFQTPITPAPPRL